MYVSKNLKIKRNIFKMAKKINILLIFNNHKY